MTHHIRALFALWEGGGNVAPTVAAIAALTSRGHTVAVLADDASAADVAATGARVLPWRRAPNRPDRQPESDLVRDWEVPHHEQLPRLLDRLIMGPARSYAYDVVDAIAAFDPDVVVVADLLFGAMVGAEAAHRPWAAFSPNLPVFPIPGLPAFGPGFAPARNEAERARDAYVRSRTRALFDAALPDFNALRVELGLAPLATTMDLASSAGRMLVASVRAFDYAVGSPPPELRYVGPFLERPSWVSTATPVSPAPPGDVLIAFSTTYQAQEGALRAALEAVGTLDVRANVTLGPALDARAFVCPPNVSIVAGDDHDRLLRGARVVVTHAGHGTVMRALAHDVPLVTLPMGRDQNENAARIAHHGAGLRLVPDANALEIRDAIVTVLSDTAFAANARRLGDAIRGCDPAATFVAEVAELARERDSRVAEPASTPVG